MMTNIIKKLNSNLRHLQLAKGVNKTTVPYLDIYCLFDDSVALPEFPYIFYIADGSIRLHTPSGILDYVAGQYAVSTIDMPFKSQLIALSEQNDFLGLTISFALHSQFAGSGKK